MTNIVKKLADYSNTETAQWYFLLITLTFTAIYYLV